MTKERTALKVIRVKNKMTQEEFAKALGYSRSMYALIEQGKRAGSVKFYTKIQEVFNLGDNEMWELTKKE